VQVSPVVLLLLLIFAEVSGSDSCLTRLKISLKSATSILT